jgi:hypothetical protein
MRRTFVRGESDEWILVAGTVLTAEILSFSDAARQHLGLTVEISVSTNLRFASPFLASMSVIAIYQKTILECASVIELQERIRGIFCLVSCICGRYHRRMQEQGRVHDADSAARP